MEEDIKEAIAHLEWLLKDGILASEDEPYIKMVLNRLEQDERIIEEMAKYIREIKPNYQIYCNDDVCDYHKNNGECKHYCIINYFRKKCE